MRSKRSILLLRALCWLLWLGGAAGCAAPSSAPPKSPPHALRCDHSRCPHPYTCRYLRGADGVEGYCRLDIGRCNSDLDCAPTTQACQRFGDDPGVCVQRGL